MEDFPASHVRLPEGTGISWGKTMVLYGFYMVLYGFMILCEMVKHSPTFYSKHLWFRLSQGPPRWSKMFGPAAA
jgi:hypothetical protein